MNPPAAILFDLDNTLVDRQGALRRACAEWVVDRFPRLPAVQCSRFVDEFIDRDGWGYAPRENLAVWMKTSLPFAEESAIHWIGELRLRCLEHVQPDPSVGELLEQLAGQCQLGVISNGASRLQRAKLTRAGLNGHFSTVLISQEFGERKPSRRIFQAALSELHCQSHDAVFVGDDPWRDIQGAASVGMDTCWVAHGRTYPADALQPDRVIDNLRHSDAKALLG